MDPGRYPRKQTTASSSFPIVTTTRSCLPPSYIFFPRSFDFQSSSSYLRSYNLKPTSLSPLPGQGATMEALKPRSVLSGAFFGAALTASGVWSPTVIVQQLHFEDFHMLKVFLSASASSAYAFLPRPFFPCQAASPSQQQNPNSQP